MQMASNDPLATFLSDLPAASAVRMRTLAHSWEGGGGTLHIGKLAIRLLGKDASGLVFTAGALHRERHGAPCLELGRVLLQVHGVSAEAWRDWCDERAELRDHGFDANAKFPIVRLDALPDGPLARLALGLRDLAMASQPHRKS